MHYFVSLRASAVWAALLGGLLLVACSCPDQAVPDAIGASGSEATAGADTRVGSEGGGTAGAALAGVASAASRLSSGGGGASGDGVGRGGDAPDGESDAAGGAGTFSQVGVCGQRGQGTVDGATFEGFEEFYLIGDEGFGEDICVVRFDVTRVGAAPLGCDDAAAGNKCLWTHLVEYGNAKVVTDTDGVCENSELGLDTAAIAAITGSQVAYGFVSEYAGHNSVLMKYDEEAASWEAYGNATWDEPAAAFRFDRRDGFCGY
jgi:hypothetical protein